MKHWMLLLAGCALLALALPVATRADEPRSPNAQKLCPVMNDPINPNLYVDFEGKRIYVSCTHSLDIVKANPKKFVRQLESEGITLEPAPKSEQNDKGRDAGRGTNVEGRLERGAK